ncbi:dTDP-4-dehydrorhamnose 3,5-epimerase family protein [Nocardioides pocheonensis]|uniref:dTDP-4-keto-6-deoxy-D-glucose epimerase n=1 Tax=Nocardioides pocheonensis TaxID=661485 RepID=A0A3N0GMC8_9ACTN|nr:dTDP-4-dehydrorhamnose 3,5-epimerase [Nocardioides pocheonensis]RNM13549.1 dTDP-4-keto-6-deoxy-D-glucose epimerase [Nocardioides pocheonensis]
MLIEETKIPGAFSVTPQQHRDDRGVFLEWFRSDRFAEAAGHPFTIAQANCSVSSAGTVRGIHFAQLPPSQAKYVTCPSGAILDVVVDIRLGSPTYGQWDAVVLDDVDRKALYIGEGLGHAFMALADDTVVNYLCSAPYAPGREHGVHPLDPAIAVAWPTEGRDGRPLTPSLSPKDAQAPTLAEVAESGVLPTYDEVQDFLDSLRADR